MRSAVKALMNIQATSIFLRFSPQICTPHAVVIKMFIVFVIPPVRHIIPENRTFTVRDNAVGAIIDAAMTFWVNLVERRNIGRILSAVNKHIHIMSAGQC